MLKETPIQELRRMIQDRYNEQNCFEYGELLNWIDNVFIEKEKQEIILAVSTTLNIVFKNPVDSLGDAHAYYQETFKQIP